MKRHVTLIAFLVLCSFVQAQNMGVGVPVPLERLDVGGAVRIGATSTTNAGTLRFLGGRFEGYNGASWNWLNGFRLPLDSTLAVSGNSVLRIINSETTGPSYGIEGQTTSPSGVGVLGTSLSTSGNGVGVYGRHRSVTSGAGVVGESQSGNITGENSGVYGVNLGIPTGAGIVYGVYGNTNSITGRAVGVRGSSSSPGGQGIWGNNLSVTGQAIGILGESSSTSGIGMRGIALATTGNTIGMEGISNSPDGFGVVGSNTSVTGQAVGVYGTHVSSISGAGVYARSLATNVFGENSALYAQNDGTAAPGANAYGVFGNAVGITGATFGVYGRSSSTTGRGVFGWAIANTGINYGVFGQSNSADGSGLYGFNSSTGWALQTLGRIRFSGINAANGRVLTSNANGDATWQDLPAVALTGVGTFASQVIPDNSITLVQLNTITHGDAGAFNTSTSEYTVPASGVYLITANVAFFTSLPDNTPVVVFIYRDGLPFRNSQTRITGQSAISYSIQVQLSQNSVLDLRVFQASGSNAQLLNGATDFSIVRLR
ncbi:MAG TPA: hypothetical protein PKE63_00840 [Lacibacter sp.]|nr:hypothetical protein [Lacibacter sp.]HMO90549.1 hypothetical protein [Lacibacter sp.]HMP85789.1 hypothetical protein [Lacibacter sp.]